MADIYHLPDVLKAWPWPRSINPNYEVCHAESLGWCQTFSEALSPADLLALKRSDFSRLASLTYPLLNEAGCRLACRLIATVFVIEEYSDTASKDVVRHRMDSIKDALRNPLQPRPAGEWVGGEFVRQFWEDAIKIVTPSAQARFLAVYEAYLDAVVEEASDRHANRIRDVKSYFDIRRDTIAVKPCFALLQMHMDLPGTVLDDSVILELTELAVDMVIISNDLYSYNKEQAVGDENLNLVTIVMHQLHIDMAAALNWISDLHADIVNRFLRVWTNIPTYGGPLDRDVRIYVDGLANWVRGNDCWYFECERYFGSSGAEISRTREVKLLPKCV